MRSLILILVGGVLLQAVPAAGAVWSVPDPVATVGEAVGLAGPGDTVLVDCGVYVEHDIALTDGILIRSATGDPDCVVIDAQGAGRVFVSDDPAGEVVIEGITVTGGSAPGMAAPTGWGGGLLFIGAPPTLVDCRITGNSASAGGGLALGGHGTPTLVRCEVADNTALYGGGLLCQVATAALDGCIFAGNAADSSGGGIYASLSDVTVTGCTFFQNTASLKGGGLYGDLETVFTLDRTILAGSAVEAVWCDSTSFASAGCCDVFGSAGGDWTGALAGQEDVSGNFSADPRFCNATSRDLGLRADSPCLPGLHPNGDPCGLIGALGEACGAVGVPATPGGRPGTVLRLWPNPFRGALRVAYDLPRPEEGRLEIFDVAGRRVRSFEVRGAGGVLVWDGRDDRGASQSTGIYYLRLRTAARTETHRVLLLR